MGELEIVPVSDGMVRFDATSFFNTTTDADWEVEAHRQFLDEDGRLTLSIGCFLVRSPDHTVLVDCGLRFNDGDAWQGGRLAEALQAAAVSPEEVNDVILTHLHFDHVGWTAVGDGDEAAAAFFPRATYRCHEADLAWHPEVFADTYAQQIEPILDRFEPFDGDGTAAPGVSVIAAPGHTPGHSVVVVSSGGDRALLLGDAIHCPIQFTESDWSMGRYSLDSTGRFRREVRPDEPRSRRFRRIQPGGRAREGRGSGQTDPLPAPSPLRFGS